MVDWTEIYYIALTVDLQDLGGKEKQLTTFSISKCDLFFILSVISWLSIQISFHCLLFFIIHSRKNVRKRSWHWIRRRSSFTSRKWWCKWQGRKERSTQTTQTGTQHHHLCNGVIERVHLLARMRIRLEIEYVLSQKLYMLSCQE